MSEIRNLTRNGETFYPLTHVDGVLGRNGVPLGEVNDIFDISEYNASGNPLVYPQYDTLALALAAVPQDRRKGGMTIRYIDSVSGKYVQYRYMSTSILNTDFINTFNWQGQEVDAVPTKGSMNLVQSGGVYRDTPTNDNLSIYNAELCVSDENGFSILCLNEGHIISEKFDSADVENLQSKEDFEADLDIADSSGYVVLRLDNGHIQTEKFNSEDIANLQSKEDIESDFDITDNSGYVVLRLDNGHIKTEKFNSAGHWVGKKWYGFGTSITNTSNEGKYAKYLSIISGMLFVNKGHSGGGITTYSDQAIYNDIFSSDLSDADLITLEIGANDAGAPLGTIYDALSGSSVTGNSTFCGALNLCIRHLQATTSAQIVVISSPRSRYQYRHPENLYDGDETFGSDNHSSTDRDEAIRKVCMLNSCYCILAGSEDGMGYARMNASDDYNVDQVHHTELGGYNFAQSIWSKLKNIPLFYTQIPL